MGTKLRVGSVFARSIAVLGRNFTPFMLLALVITLPDALYEHFLFPDGAQPAAGIVAYIPYFLVSFVLDCFLTAAITYRTVADLRGTPADLFDVLRQSGSLALPVLAVAVVTGLLTMLGMIALVIPGVIVITRLAVAIPVVVVERNGVRASLERSQELTEGNRWRVFAVIIILSGIAYAVGAIIEDAFGHSGLATLIGWLVSAPISAWGSVAAAVLYHDLRLIKEREGSAGTLS